MTLLNQSLCAFTAAPALRVGGQWSVGEAVCKRHTGTQVTGRLARARRCKVRQQTVLCVPNDEADWVVADILVEGASQADDALQRTVQDDVKSLVRCALRDAAAEVSVVLCSDEHMRSLNGQWRGKDAPTDVLSFPQDDPDGVVLGDVVVSLDTAERQAAERGVDLIDEIRVLLVHGLLHLLGYDHEGAKEGDWLIVSFQLCPIALV